MPAGGVCRCLSRDWMWLAALIVCRCFENTSTAAFFGSGFAGQ